MMCGKTTYNRRTFITLLGTGAITAIAGCSGESESTADSEGDGSYSGGPYSGESNEDGTGDESSNGSSGGGIDVLNHELTETAIGWEVNGEVQNNTGEEQQYIEVRVTFYNMDGTRIDEWFDNATDVADGEIVAFTVSAATDEEVSEYNLETSTDPLS